MRALHVGLLLVTLAIAGCQETPDNIEWTLVDLGGLPARSVGDDGAPTLKLDVRAKRASGNAGCNRFSGPYEMRGDSLLFGALVSTKRACAEAEMNTQEVAYLGALAATRTWRADNDMLVLDGDAGTLARFTKQ